MKISDLNLTKIAADFDRFSAEAHGGPGVITWADVTPADLEDAAAVTDTAADLVDELVSRFAGPPAW